ncbi:unnamed protein product [Bemisia tabaci]|uniref:Uncharacterized protein n=1 Tax=Bemisia tabaci TaxID=7038 RepID=A0A9P0EY58_BEMTA|nr:unnamed protein product [Bemisia tabaci]
MLAFCTERDVPVDEGPRNSTRRKIPRRMDDFVVSSVGKNDTIELSPERSVMDHWKVNVYLPVMDAVISGFKRRFQNLPFAKAIDTFVELDIEGAKEFVNHYDKHSMKVNIDMLQAEVNVIKNLLRNREK